MTPLQVPTNSAKDCEDLEIPLKAPPSGERGPN